LRRLVLGAGGVALAGAWSGVARAQEAGLLFPRIELGVASAEGPADVALTLQIVALLTVLTLAPAILVMLTSFTRIVVVLSFVRSALALQQTPPNQVLIGLALFLTFFTMAPTWQAVYEQGLQPYLAGELSEVEALQRAVGPLREFMLHHTRERDLELFVELSGGSQAGHGRRLADARHHSRLRHQRAAHRVSARVHLVHPVPCHRHGGRQHADVHGNVDAAAGHDLAAVQDFAVHSG